ncbi:2dc17374-6377-4a4a-a19a-a1efa1c260e8 [Thermothielavioides terrestris]|uniref:Delta(24)-sterol reductase n=1 Tax=Thermothielavioides terrestris TaxID=2587410 RepID=A0A3S4BLP7_9PEZI|nr:2dc17374-6377-4a4a-a19a-a1efa1c260e8 [Thermothielavioides terrestris]
MSISASNAQPLTQMDSHQAVVSQIALTVQQFFAQNEPFRIYHGSTNSTRPAHDARVVDISALNNVLKIDEGSRIAVVEPNVPMDKLVQSTLARGLIPPVVMEFPGITVGGGFAGSAGESSSFRYGYFDQTVKSIEMVLATGEVVQASPSQNPDLFRGAAGTAGTLGIVTKLELTLVPARKYVKLEYRRHNTVNDTISAVKQATEDPLNDYVDGILFAPNFGVVMTGQLTDEIPMGARPQTFSGRRDPWFYLHARKRAEFQHGGAQNAPPTDYIPLPEYLFRYDRGGFWVGAEAFAYFPFVPFNRLTRWFLNDFMHTRMLYRALQGSNLSFGHMVQDLSLPYGTAEAFIDYTAKEFNIWPLWLCPLKAIERPTFHPSYCGPGGDGPPQPMVNIGLWGAASNDVEEFVRQNRELEKKLTQLGGRKVLYSHTYYTEEEFWGLYDKGWYDGLREKYGATTLPSLYDK